MPELVVVLGALKHLLMHRRDYHVAHLHLNHSLWSRLLARVVKIAGLPLVVTLNVSLLSDGPSSAAPDDERRARWPERQALAAADRIVALTRRHLETVRAQVPHRLADVRIVPDAVDAAEYATAASPQRLAEFCASFGVPTDGPVAAYVGRIGDEKGWRDLPRIVATLAARGVFVLICGDGPRRKALERQLVALGLPSHWTITGFVPPDTVKLALQRARVVMLPSRREAFGSVLLEAMASGVPAVAYAVGGIVEVAGGSAAIALIEPGDLAAFVTAVGDLLDRDELHRARVAAGRERVHDFGIEQTRDGILAIYRELAARRR